MARKTISQRIALEGGEAVRRQLESIGKDGERAFRDIQAAADKLRGPGAAFARSMDKVRKQIRSVGEQMETTGRQMRNVGVGMSAAITAPLALLGHRAVAAWRVQEEAIAQVEAALISTGGAAGKTSAELQAAAAAFQGASTFGDEEILQAQSVLLTFTEITEEQFDAATQAVIDLATRMNMDLRSAALLVGKALNDPVKGMSALTRAGIQFSKEQEAAIKRLGDTGSASDAAASRFRRFGEATDEANSKLKGFGDGAASRFRKVGQEIGGVAQAQEMILGELDTQFGGSALAKAGTDSGKLTQAINDLGDAFEGLGKAMAPALTVLAEKVSEVSKAFQALPASTQENIVIFGAIAAAVGPVITVLGSAVLVLGGVAKAVAVVLGLGAPLIGMLGGLGGAFTAVVGTVGAVGAALLGLVGTVASAVAGIIGTVAAAIAGFATGAIIAAALVALVALVYTYWDEITAAVSAGASAAAELAAAAWDGVTEAAAGAWQAVVDTVAGAWDAVVAAVVAGAQGLASEAAIAWAGIVDAFDVAVGGMTDRLGDFADLARSIFGGTSDFVVDQFDGIRSSVASVVDWAADRLRSLRSLISDVTGFSGGGPVGGTPGFAGGGGVSIPGFAGGGGVVRGPGTATSDSILARLSRGEFVIRAAAVQHYGPRLFELLNRMRLPRMPGFAAGGEVSFPALTQRLVPALPIPGFADGGLVPAPAGGQQMAAVTLNIGGETFSGLMAPRDVADRLVRFAMGEEVKSAGRRPGWFRNG